MILERFAHDDLIWVVVAKREVIVAVRALKFDCRNTFEKVGHV